MSSNIQIKYTPYMYISQKKKKTTKNNDENDQISLMFGIPRLI